MRVVDKDLTDFELQLAQAKGHEETVEALSQIVALRAVERLVGPITGRSVLDLACGDGKLSRWLASHGARVTGVDSSPEAISAAKRRETQEHCGIDYMVGDIEDLYMIEDSTFDDVICHLALDKVESLSSVVAEVSRIIKLGGRFVFSVGHPCFESSLLMALKGNPDAGHRYFSEEMRYGFGGTVRHRTLATYINAVAARGFTVRRVMEPAAEEKDITSRPDYGSWKHIPVALAVEAVFPHL
jgi:SAM-dependent methyltransferase